MAFLYNAWVYGQSAHRLATHLLRIARDGDGAATAEPDQLLDQLTKLGELHRAGVLTDDEFSDQKARLLS